MTLQQIFDRVNKKTYFSREDDEIWAAISNASSTIYLQVESEHRGFFRVTDTSSLALVAGQEEYVLPQACGELERLRESTTGNPSTDPWRVILPADLNDDSVTEAAFRGAGDPLNSASSQFKYVGPYLTQAAAQTAGKAQSVKIAPIPQDARFCELIYIAKFVDITGQESFKVLPDEADGAVMWSAVEELLTDNDDDAADRAAAQKNENLVWFMKWVRNRQSQQGRQVDPYLDDLD
jgi:hypothetical protein